MDLDTQLAELLTALDTVSDQVEQWAPPQDTTRQPDPCDPGSPSSSTPGQPGPEPVGRRTARPGATEGTVRGAGPEAHEERAIRAANATLAQQRARQMREGLADVRVRARRMADEARSAAWDAAHESERAQRPLAGPATVAAALHTAAAQLHSLDDLDQAMGHVVAGALSVLPRARWGGLCVENRTRTPAPAHEPDRELRRVDVHAASDPLVERLEALQARHGEGPCVQALHDRDTVYVPDLLVDRRWPHFARVAGELGVRSVLAVGLPVAHPGGVLNLYGPHPDAFDEDARALVAVFAEHAAIALTGARRVGQLQRAVDTRDLIGQAKGILMHRHGVTADQAFQMLVDASQNANLKLVDVARWAIDNTAAL